MTSALEPLAAGARSKVQFASTTVPISATEVSGQRPFAYAKMALHLTSSDVDRLVDGNRVIR
jgi:hypothetical protein